MKAKLSLVILGFVAMFLVSGMNGGCGGTTTSTTYYYPNWLPDGRIIACKEEMTRTTNLWGVGVSDYKYYITALTINNSNEVTNEENLFEIDQRAAEIICSPTGEMIAYVTNLASASDVVMTDYEGNVVKTPNIQANYLDWSPDATRIVYSYGRRLYVVDVDGTNNTQIATSAEAVAWRVGDKIAYEDSIYNKIWLSDPEGSSKEVVVASISSRPQVSNDNKIIFQGAGDQIKSINMSGTGETELFSGYERATVKLSFDNTKIVGGDYRSSGITGIYVINIDGTGEKQLR